MAEYTIKLEKGGKITLPTEYIKALYLKEGAKMKIEMIMKDDLPYLFIYPNKQEAVDIL